MRALIFGEDFTTDPVSQGLGIALRYFSGGAIALNVPLVSQVRSQLFKSIKLATPHRVIVCSRCQHLFSRSRLQQH